MEDEPRFLIDTAPHTWQTIVLMVKLVAYVESHGHTLRARNLTISFS